MENRGARADQCGGDEDHSKRPSHRQQNQANQREGHAGGQGVRLGTVGVKAYEGLQKGRGELIRERDESYLCEIEMKGVLEQGIYGGQEGGHHVVQEMANADDRQNLRTVFDPLCSEEFTCVVLTGVLGLAVNAVCFAREVYLGSLRFPPQREETPA